MKIKCIYNTGKDLMKFQNKPSSNSRVLLTDSKNRSFWCTGETIFGGLEVGKEYLVMGMVIRDGLLHYLIDDGFEYIYLLFEVTDNKISQNWYFRIFSKDDSNYNNREAIWGYYELCFDDNHFIKLLDMDEEAMLIFFKRKIEEENTDHDSSESI